MKMRKILMYLLPVLVIWVLAGIALTSRWARRSGASVEKSASLVLPALDFDSVTDIRLSWRTGWVADLKRESNGRWVVVQRGHSADEKRINELFDALRRMVPLKVFLPADRALLKRLRVDPETDGNREISGIRLVLKNGGTVLYDVMLGRGHFITETDSIQPSARNVPEGRYLGRIMPDGKVIPFLTATLFEEFHPNPGLWIKTPAFGDPVRALQFRFSSKKYVNWAIGRTNVRMPFTSLLPGKGIVSQSELNTLITTLRRPFISDCIRKKDFRFQRQPEGELTIASNGTVTKIAFFSRKDNPRDIYAEFSNDSEFYYQVPKQAFDLMKKSPVLKTGRVGR